MDTAQILVEQLKQIGVNAKIQLVEWDSWLSDVYTDRKFQSTVVGVDAVYLSGRALLERFTSDASKNFINFNNEEYDKLYEQVQKMMPPMSISRIWPVKWCLERILADMYSIPFMYWIWQRFTRQNEPGNCPVEEEKDRMKYTIKK